MSKLLLYEDLAIAIKRIKLKSHHLQNSPSPLKASILKKGPWPTIQGSHREMDTLLSIFPLAILQTPNAHEIFNSPPYEIVKLLRKIAYLLGKKSLSHREMDEMKNSWELVFNKRLQITDQNNPATVVKKQKSRGNQRGNSHRTPIPSDIDSSQQSQQDLFSSQASPLLFGDGEEQGEQHADNAEEPELVDEGDHVLDEDVDEGDLVANDVEEELDRVNSQNRGQETRTAGVQVDGENEKYYPALIPKEHYLSHLSCQIKNFGPPSRSLSTQAYEQKHQGQSHIYMLL